MSNDQDNTKRQQRLDQLALGMMARMVNPKHIKDAMNRFSQPPQNDDKKDG